MSVKVWKKHIDRLQYDVDPKELIQIDIPKNLQKKFPNAKVLKWKTQPDYPQPSDVRISTMTMTGFLSSLVYMRPVFYLVDLFDPSEIFTYTDNDPDIYNVCKKFLESRFVKYHYNYSCDIITLIQQLKKQNIDMKHEIVSCLADLLGLPIQLEKSTIISILKQHPRIEYHHGSGIIKGMKITDLFPALLDVSWGAQKRGNIKLSAKKAPKKDSFYNQCTMRIVIDDLDNGGVINLKIFKNGKLQVTGCKSPNDVETAIKFLSKKLQIMSKYMNIKNKTLRELRLSFIQPPNVDVLSILKSDNLWIKIFDYCDQLELTILQHVCIKFNNIFDTEDFWLKRCEQEFGYKFIQVSDSPRSWKVHKKWYEKYQTFKRIYKSIIFEDAKKFYYSYFTEKKLPFIPLSSEEEIQFEKINIEMINSDFNVFFFINQTKLADILRDDPYNLFVKFNPSSYPGVNVKYYCKTGPPNRKASILIFRTGKIIITGKIDHEQLKETYDFINGFLREHYSEIWAHKLPNE